MKKLVLLIGFGLLVSCSKPNKNVPEIVYQTRDSIVYVDNTHDTIIPIFGLDAINHIAKSGESRSTNKLIVLMSGIGQITDKIKSVDEVKLGWVENSGELLSVITIKNLKLK